MTFNSQNLQQNRQLSSINKELINSNSFFSRVMAWLFFSFSAAAIGIFFIGPVVPASFMLPLGLIALGILVASAFSRRSAKFAPLFAILIPFILGITLYPVLNSYVATGAGDLIFMAAAGTAIVFGSMAFLAWTSKKSLDSWGNKLFVILIGVIALSLLNVFFFKLSVLSLLISFAVLVIFSIYSFIDIQKLKNHVDDGMVHPAVFALNIFLDIWNIFVSILNILSIFRS